jgi:hypothetical protein
MANDISIESAQQKALKFNWVNLKRPRKEGFRCLIFESVKSGYAFSAKLVRGIAAGQSVKTDNEMQFIFLKIVIFLRYRIM